MRKNKDFPSPKYLKNGRKRILLEDDIKNKDTEAFDIIWLHEETKFLFKHADKIRDLKDTELRQILIWVRYNGQILYKKNQGYRTLILALVMLFSIYEVQYFLNGATSWDSFEHMLDIFDGIQRKNDFKRMIAMINLYINTIASNKEEILSRLSDKEKVLYEL